LDELIEDRFDDWMADILRRRLNPRTPIRRLERDLDNLEWLNEWMDGQGYAKHTASPGR